MHQLAEIVDDNRIRNLFRTSASVNLESECFQFVLGGRRHALPNVLHALAKEHLRFIEAGNYLAYLVWTVLKMELETFVKC